MIFGEPARSRFARASVNRSRGSINKSGYHHREYQRVTTVAAAGTQTRGAAVQCVVFASTAINPVKIKYEG